MQTVENLMDPQRQKAKQEARYRGVLEYIQHNLVDDFNRKSALGNNFKLFIRFAEDKYYGLKKRRDKNLALAVACVIDSFVDRLRTLGWRLKITYRVEWLGLGVGYLKVEEIK